MAARAESRPMGDAARRAYLKRTTPEQRLDEGIRMAQAAMEAALREEGLPTSDLTEAQAREAFRALRKRSRG